MLSTRALETGLQFAAEQILSLSHAHDAVGHYILQMQQASDMTAYKPLLGSRQMSQTMLQLGPPQFKLFGLAIGNGLTDPTLQVMILSAVLALCNTCSAR